MRALESDPKAQLTTRWNQDIAKGNKRNKWIKCSLKVGGCSARAIPVKVGPEHGSSGEVCELAAMYGAVHGQQKDGEGPKIHDSVPRASTRLVRQTRNRKEWIIPASVPSRLH